jgi:hypothetical protein
MVAAQKNGINKHHLCFIWRILLIIVRRFEGIWKLTSLHHSIMLETGPWKFYVFFFQAWCKITTLTWLARIVKCNADIEKTNPKNWGSRSWPRHEAKTLLQKLGPGFSRMNSAPKGLDLSWKGDGEHSTRRQFENFVETNEAVVLGSSPRHCTASLLTVQFGSHARSVLRWEEASSKWNQKNN